MPTEQSQPATDGCDTPASNKTDSPHGSGSKSPLSIHAPSTNNKPRPTDRSRHASVITPTILASDLLEGELEVSASRLQLIMKILDDHDSLFDLYQFNEMQSGESLKDHVQRQLDAGTCKGPFDEETIRYLSRVFLRDAQLPSFEAGRSAIAKFWRGGLGQGWFGFWRLSADAMTNTPIHQGQEWLTFLKNILAGKTEHYSFPGIIWGTPDGVESRAWNIINVPYIVVSDDKKTRSWGMIRQLVPFAEEERKVWGLRNLQLIKNSPTVITSVSVETGEILYQNTASMALYGNHGSMNAVQPSARMDKASVANIISDAAAADSESIEGSQSYKASLGEHPIGSFIPATSSQWQVAQGDSDQASSRAPRSPSTILEDKLMDEKYQEEEGLSFLELLFIGHEDALHNLKTTIVSGLCHARIEIKSHRLRRWMLLDSSTESFHDLQIASTVEPVTFKRIYVISQTDVTEGVLAQRRVQEANAQLAEERQRMHALLQRQYELIEVMQSTAKNDPAFDNPHSQSLFKEKIQVLRDILSEARGSDREAEEISLGKILGQGNFGAVYLGEWRGATVAVKRMVLPAAMTNSERAHKMAVMEIGISSSMAHPNLVQTYTYSIRPIQDENSGGSQSTVTGHELRLVMEYCDRGSLGGLLKDYGGFKDDEGLLDYAAVLETASDIAKGMMHLHKNNICHKDLKANNVMFKSEGNDGRGVRAKVVDFGLSIKLDSSATHLSNAFQGTMTHMAPEVMMEGKQSRAAYVYAFGVTLWELFTGGSPYKGLPPAALSQVVVFQQKRPAWPGSTPLEFKSLAEECWQPNPSARPPFESILNKLTRMRSVIQEKSKPLESILARSPSSLGQAESGPPILSLAEHASINFSMSEWVPHIMGDVKPLPPSAPTLPLEPLPPPRTLPSVLTLPSAVGVPLSSSPHVMGDVKPLLPPTTKPILIRPMIETEPRPVPTAALPVSFLQLADLQTAAANSVKGKNSAGGLDSRDPGQVVISSRLGRLDEDLEGPSPTMSLSPPSPMSRKLSSGGDFLGRLKSNSRDDMSRQSSINQLVDQIASIQAEANVILGGRPTLASDASAGLTAYARMSLPPSDGSKSLQSSPYAGSQFVKSSNLLPGSSSTIRLAAASGSNAIVADVSRSSTADVFHSGRDSPTLHSLVSARGRECGIEHHVGPAAGRPIMPEPPLTPIAAGARIRTSEEVPAAMEEKKKKQSLVARFMSAFK